MSQGHPQHNGAGARSGFPLPTIEDFVVINKGGLAASFRLGMPSGMIVRCLLFRQKKDPTQFFCSPVGERIGNGAYAPIIEWASPERSQAWQDQAMSALAPYLNELKQPTKAIREEASYDRCPF